MEEKLRKISGETFQQKFNNAKKIHKAKIARILKKRNAELEHTKTKSEKKLIIQKTRFLIKKQKNRYALKYNAINDNKLYRKSAYEVQLDKLKTEYKYKKKHSRIFDEEVEKEKLKKNIKKIEKRYSKPVSSELRRKRNSKTDDSLGFIRIPLNTPLRRNIKSLTLLLLAAFITTLALDVFIKPFGIYNAGLRGVTQMIYYVIKHHEPSTSTSISYVLFFGLNIPLALFGWFKVGKRFTISTITFIVMQYLISLGLDISHIEKHIMPYGKTANDIYKITSSSSYSEPLYKFGLPFISALLGGIFYGIGVGIIYRAGGSTGGSKFIVTWISSKKQKSIGLIAMLLSIFVITTGIIVNHIIINGENIISAFTSTTLFASITFVYMSNWALDKVFAKSGKQTIEVITTKKIQIVKFLDIQLMYNRTFTSESITTGFEKEKKDKLTFLVSKQESKLLTNVFSKIDPKALITTTNVEAVMGKFYSKWFE